MSGREPFVKFIPIEVALPAPRLVLLDQESPEETVGRFGTGEDPDHPLPSAIDGSLRTQSSPSEKQNRSRILWREARRVLPLRSSAFSPTPRSASSCACASCSPASSRAISFVAKGRRMRVTSGVCARANEVAERPARGRIGLLLTSQ